MEKTPLTTADLEEVDVRNLILFVLNANYEGAVHGEVFNGVGKTDILLSYKNHNAFIAECKFWHGTVKFHEALDQLLGYLVWRDSKAALLLFIRQSNAAAVIEKACAAVQSHESFVDVISEDKESSSFRYTVRSTLDQNRLIDLALVPVVVTVPGDAAPAPDDDE